MISTLLAIQQADAAFPSGAFAFSNGIEGMAALPMLFDAGALRRHAEVTIRHRWAGLDRVALAHAWRAAGTMSQLARIDEAVEAASPVAAFRAGSRRAGRALLTSHARLATRGAAELREAIGSGYLLGHLPVVQGALFDALGLSEAEAMAVSAYQILSSLAAASVRLGRVGALEAQSVILDLLPVVAALAEPSLVGPELQLESFAPLLDIAVMRSADAELRLFAN